VNAVGKTIIAGVFPSDAHAEEASLGLQKLGLREHEIDIRAPEPGRYRIDADEATELGRGAAIGVAIGVPVGGLLGIAFGIAAVPGGLSSGIIGVAFGFLVGAFWGTFFGGLAGVVPKVLAHERGPRSYSVSEGAADAVVIAYAGKRADDARKVMKKRGARAFLTRIPAVRDVTAPGVIEQVA
jgi:hypothetical protein